MAIATLACLMIGMVEWPLPVSATEAPDRSVDPHLITVYALARTCQSNSDLQHQVCLAYLVAAADTLTTFGNSGSRNGLCQTDYASTDLPRLFVRWTERHTGLAESPALLGVIMALREKWPCR